MSLLPKTSGSLPFSHRVFPHGLRAKDSLSPVPQCHCVTSGITGDASQPVSWNIHYKAKPGFSFPTWIISVLCNTEIERYCCQLGSDIGSPWMIMSSVKHSGLEEAPQGFPFSQGGHIDLNKPFVTAKESSWK